MKSMTTTMIQVIRLFRLLLSRKNKNTQKRKYTKKDFRFPHEKHESANFFWSENDKEIFHEKRKTRKSNLRGKRNTRRNKFMNFRKIILSFYELYRSDVFRFETLTTQVFVYPRNHYRVPYQKQSEFCTILANVAKAELENILRRFVIGKLKTQTEHKSGFFVGSKFDGMKRTLVTWIALLFGENERDYEKIHHCAWVNEQKSWKKIHENFKNFERYKFDRNLFTSSAFLLSINFK